MDGSKHSNGASPLFYDPYDRNRAIAAGMMCNSSRETIDEMKRERRQSRRERTEAAGEAESAEKLAETLLDKLGTLPGRDQ